jgi:hypothetical protein
LISLDAIQRFTGTLGGSGIILLSQQLNQLT